MLLRATLTAVATAALLPFLGGAAHASCADDLADTSIAEGYYLSPKSQYWIAGYAEVNGTANLELHGDALVSDWSEFATTDMPNYTFIVVGNAASATTEFVDCVAG